MAMIRVLSRDTTRVSQGYNPGYKYFCWSCNKKWINKYDNKLCGNSECESTQQYAYDLLLNCPVKKIGNVKNVPSIRSCPKCSQLIEHTEACKHMQCKKCGN